MSIKDNIKEELLKRINNRENLCRQYHNQDVDLMQGDQELFEYHSGHINAIDEELIFLHGLIEFVKSL